MPKTKRPAAFKIQTILRDHPNEFQQSPNNQLFCKLCCVIVNFEKRHFVESHCASLSHQRRLNGLNQQSATSSQTFLTHRDDFRTDLIKAFLSALKKLRNPDIISLFNKIGYVLPSESACRQRVIEVAEEEFVSVKSKLHDEIFLIVDESDIQNKKFVNVLAGSLSQTEKVYLVSCKELLKSSSALDIVRCIDDAIHSIDCRRENFCLLISDAAPYMLAAGRSLSSLYPRLFHTCLAHLLHNCALRVKSHFSKVDNLIATVKAAVVKNKTRLALFGDIGSPPQPIVTRWGTWLSAVAFYADHLPTVREIVTRFESDGIIVTRAMDAVNEPTLPMDLVTIQRCYSCLLPLIQQSESKSFTLQDGYKAITALDFKEDPCNLLPYVTQRLGRNGISDIVMLKRSDISPALYSKLQCAPASSAEVERSFSMLRKLLAKDRNFLPNNVEKYFMLYFNKNNQ